jgi:hypothetical protein
MDSLNTLTLMEALGGLEKKRFRSFDLVESCLARMAEVEPKIKAFVSFNEELVYKKAREADRIIQSKEFLGQNHYSEYQFQLKIIFVQKNSGPQPQAIFWRTIFHLITLPLSRNLRMLEP